MIDLVKGRCLLSPEEWQEALLESFAWWRARAGGGCCVADRRGCRLRSCPAAKGCGSGTVVRCLAPLRSYRSAFGGCRCGGRPSAQSCMRDAWVCIMAAGQSFAIHTGQNLLLWLLLLLMLISLVLEELHRPRRP